MQPQFATKAEFHGHRNHRGGYSRNDRIAYSFRPERIHRNNADFERLLAASIRKAKASQGGQR